MITLTGALREEAIKLDIPFVDGDTITRAHWFGSWDGLHYSEMFSHYVNGQNTTVPGVIPSQKGADHRWFGGASMMITQIFINMLCNRPCNPNFQ